MKSITIRGIGPELDEKIKNAATQQGKSANRLILDIIKKEFGLKKERQYCKEYNDLDDLFGRWTEEEFQQIESKINTERQIDQDLWI